MKEYIGYKFTAKLLKINALNDADYFEAPFIIIAKDKIVARDKLRKYLENPEQTGYNYKECLGIGESGCKLCYIVEEGL